MEGTGRIVVVLVVVLVVFSSVLTIPDSDGLPTPPYSRLGSSVAGVVGVVGVAGVLNLPETP